MARRNQFKVDAESVQGNTGAWLEFRGIKVREWREWLDDPERHDVDLLSIYLVAWGGFEDDEGNELPSPKDEPGILNELYIHEQQTIVTLLMQGPVDQKN